MSRERRAWTVAAAALALALAAATAEGLSGDGRLALFAFGLALILWTGTALPIASVALGAALLAVIGGAAEPQALQQGLGSAVVWLMIGAFIFGGAVRSSGLAAALTAVVARRARTVGGALWLVACALLPLSLVIPSTSARAAIALPVLRPLTEAAGDERATRALMLLAPVVILVSTIASLVGAGSHLIANEVLAGATGERIGFGEWLLYGLPFAVVATALSCFAIGRMFLDRATRRRPVTAANVGIAPLGRDAWVTLGVGAGMVALWLSAGWHGVDVASVAVLGALVLTWPGIGPLRWKEALASVSWDLVVFVAAALVLGKALISSGAAAWMMDSAGGVLGLGAGGAGLATVAGIAALSLTAHVYMTSHAARTAALLPPLLLLAAEARIDPVAVAFIATVGINYCLTFPVSSKALLIFQAEGAWRPADLMRLSAVLLPAHLLLMLVFAATWWRWVGLL